VIRVSVHPSKALFGQGGIFILKYPFDSVFPFHNILYVDTHGQSPWNSALRVSRIYLFMFILCDGSICNIGSMGALPLVSPYFNLNAPFVKGHRITLPVTPR